MAKYMAVALLLASLCGCYALEGFHWLTAGGGKPSPASGEIGWDTPMMVIAEGIGLLIPFDDDIEKASGSVFQIGAGCFGGGGFRFMDFTYETKGGIEYGAKTYLGYAGGGSGSTQPSGFGTYLGGALGATKLEGPGVTDEWGFTGGGVWGFTAYRDLGEFKDPPWGVLGVAVELGLFFSAPNDLGLHGMTAVIGLFLDF